VWQQWQRLRIPAGIVLAIVGTVAWYRGTLRILNWMRSMMAQASHLYKF